MEENKKAAQKKKISHAIIMVVLILLFLMFIFPVIIVIINAFKNRFKMSETDAIALVELSKRDFTNYYLKIEAYGEAIK